MKRLGFVLTLFIVLTISVLADTKQEIDHLLKFVENSPCKCERNGTIYSCKEAKGHLLFKYEYYKKRDKIHTAEDFIRYAASKSEITGRKYRAHCGNKIENSSDWLKRELISYRKKNL